VTVEGRKGCQLLKLRLGARKVAEASSLRTSGWKPLPLWAATLCEGHAQAVRLWGPEARLWGPV